MATTFDYTLELERSLLKIISSSPIQARLYMHRVKEHFFTSTERQFIFTVLSEALTTTGQVATKKVFEYEVGKKVEASDQKYFIGEWNLVDAVDTKDPPEVLIKKLEEASVGRDILQAGEDVDNLLEAGDIEGALAHLKQRAMNIGGLAAESPLVELTDYHKREQVLLDKIAHPEKYRGLRTGFDFFDACTGGLFPGELTLIAGLTGTGKSTFVRQLEMNIVVLNAGKNVLHIANEEYQEQVEHKFDANFTEIPYLDFKRGKISLEDLDKWRKYMQDWKHGRVFLKEVPAFTDVTLAEQAYRQCEAKGIKIHCIIIDHLPNVKPIQKAWGENDEQKKAAADCKELARWLRIPVAVPTQAATEVMKKQERGRRGNKLDVYGSKGQVHVANTFALITETGKDEEQTDREEWERDVFWGVDIKKNRDGPPFFFRARHRVKIGRIEELADGKGKGDAKDENDAQKKIKADASPADDAQADAVKESLAAEEAEKGGKATAASLLPSEVTGDAGTVLGMAAKLRKRKSNSGSPPSV